MLKLPKFTLRFAVLGLFALSFVSLGSVYSQDDPLPLLASGTRIGVIYSEGRTEAKAATDQAFGDTIANGVDTYEVSMYWSMLEPTSGSIDTSTLGQFLDIIQATGLTPYLVIPTIDTVRLALPSDLVDSGDPALLADERHFDDQAIIERFNALMDVVVPLLVDHGGFFIGVGNEIDVWLAAHPDEVDLFLHFFTTVRDHIHELNPDLGVGVAITFNGIREDLPFIDRFLTESDAASFTYYPLNADFTVEDPSVVEDDFAQMVDTAGDLPILMQEVGYPAGYLPTPTNDSSVEKQQQFVANVFDVIRMYPQIRFVSFLTLVDFSPETCDTFGDYYGTHQPQFIEYLCTLGMISYDGEPKPAYDEFTAQLIQFHAAETAP